MAQQVHVAPGDPPLHRRASWRPRAQHADVYLGASPRASIMLLRAARAYAAVRPARLRDPRRREGARACPCSAHRIIVTADASMNGRNTAAVIDEILASVEVPVAERE